MDKQKVIKTILQEYHGRQIDIDALEPLVTDKIINGLKDDLQYFQPNERYTFTPIFAVEDNEIKSHTKISSIVIEIIAEITNQDSITGSFRTQATKLVDNNYYQIYLTLYINVSDVNITARRPQISSVIAHELNHAFASIKTINKQSKSAVYNKAKSLTNLGMMDILPNYPLLKEFIIKSKQ